MLGMEGLDYSNMKLICHLNSMSRVCGIFETTDSKPHSISRLECGFATEKLKLFIRTASSESVTICLEILRTNLLESEADVDTRTHSVSEVLCSLVL
jgi:hypothetical protein